MSDQSCIHSYQSVSRAAPGYAVLRRALAVVLWPDFKPNPGGPS